MITVVMDSKSPTIFIIIVYNMVVKKKKKGKEAPALVAGVNTICP